MGQTNCVLAGVSRGVASIRYGEPRRATAGNEKLATARPSFDDEQRPKIALAISLPAVGRIPLLLP
jgi:hypothetical protein